MLSLGRTSSELYQRYRISKGMSTVAVNRSQTAKRRSSRLALNASIRLAGEDRVKCTFAMPARATNLNRHGPAIQVNRELLVGSTVATLA
jgi:hypothetical protein